MSERATLAWSFRSRLSLEAMRQRLDTPAGGAWSIGDSDRLGDYLGGKLTQEAVARFYATGNGTWVVQLRFLSLAGDAPAQLDAARRRLLARVLPVIDADDVQACEPLD